MYPLIRLLFKTNYWRMLLRRATWLEAWLSLQRAHKDKRARKHVGQVFLLAFIPFICLVYLAWLAGSGALMLLPLVLPFLWWRKRNEKQEMPLSILPAKPSAHRELSPDGLKAIRCFLGDLALCCAAMADRAGSESFLKENILPQGTEVASRRTHLALLRSRGVWEKMVPEDRDIMIIADGHWEWEQINRVSLVLEFVRLLRWLLKIDFYLPLVGQQLKNNFQTATELVISPDKVVDTRGLIDISTIRIGRDAAEEFFARCLAEAIHRGDYEVDDEETMSWAKGVSQRLGGKQDQDLVLGTTLVSEASAEQLSWALSISRARTHFLTYVLSLFEAEDLPSAFERIS